MYSRWNCSLCVQRVPLLLFILVATAGLFVFNTVCLIPLYLEFTRVRSAWPGFDLTSELHANSRWRHLCPNYHRNGGRHYRRRTSLVQNPLLISPLPNRHCLLARRYYIPLLFHHRHVRRQNLCVRGPAVDCTLNWGSPLSQAKSRLIESDRPWAIYLTLSQLLGPAIGVAVGDSSRKVTWSKRPQKGQKGKKTKKASCSRFSHFCFSICMEKIL